MLHSRSCFKTMINMLSKLRVNFSKRIPVRGFKPAILTLQGKYFYVFNNLILSILLYYLSKPHKNRTKNIRVHTSFVIHEPKKYHQNTPATGGLAGVFMLKAGVFKFLKNSKTGLSSVRCAINIFLFSLVIEKFSYLIHLEINNL